MSIHRRAFLGLLAGGIAATAAPASGGSGQVLGGSAFGSYWRLSLAQPGDADTLRGAIGRVIRKIDGAMSPYRPETDLSRFNRAPAGEWQPLSAETRLVLSTALDMNTRTGGAFDPTVGPVVGRFGFGPIPAGPTGNLSDLETGEDAARKRRAGLTLDLCGIAKGRALDLIGEALVDRGITDFVAELGGEVLTRGAHPSGRAWQIAVEASSAGERAVVIRPGTRAVATSGDAPQGFAVGGRRYGHIIDPRRGAPAKGTVAAATVIADSAMQADALATALCSRDADGALALADALAVDARLTLRDGATLRTVMTGRFAAHLAS